MVSKTRVLFLCTGNSCRSQMAEAFLRKYAGDRYDVYSAGLEPKPIHPLAIRVMDEAGVDIRGQRSKMLSEYAGKVQFGYLVTVCSNAEEKCPIFPGMGMRLHWPFDDPAAFQGTVEEKLQKFRSVRDQIEGKVREWIAGS